MADPEFPHQEMSDAVADGIARSMPPPAMPPRATLVGWIRLNLALMVFAMSLVTTGLGMLIAGTMRVARYDTRLEALESSRPEVLGPRVTALEEANHQDAQDRARLEQERHDRDERRVRLANDLGAINARLGVLEAQGKWVGDYIQQQMRKR